MMNLLHKVVRKNNTHDCPSCGEGSYCAMMDGKSSSSCWCMSVTATPLTDFEVSGGSECLCKKCLVGGYEDLKMLL